MDGEGLDKQINRKRSHEDVTKNHDDSNESSSKRPKTKEDSEVEDDSKRNGTGPKPPPKILYVLTHERLDDDYKHVCDTHRIVGQYPTYRLALAHKYQSMVNIINEYIEEYAVESCDELPHYMNIVKRASVTSPIVDTATLDQLYQRFFVESDDYLLELNMEAVLACLPSLRNEDVKDFAEHPAPIGFDFSDLFEVLFQCEYRNGRCRHSFDIEQRSIEPTCTDLPEIFAGALAIVLCPQ